jgi:hypothetical protein
MKKTKGSQILTFPLFIFLFSSLAFLSLFFLLSSFLVISQCYFVNFTLNSGKRREKEGERVSNRCFSMKNYTTVLFFLFFLFLARTFIFHYISIVILYVFFLSLFLMLMFFHLFFCPLYFFLFIFFLLLLSIYINQCLPFFCKFYIEFKK